MAKELAPLAYMAGGVNQLNFDQCKQMIKAWRRFTLNLLTKYEMCLRMQNSSQFRGCISQNFRPIE